MRDKIPQQILDRITWKQRDDNMLTIKSIKPLETVCEDCGERVVDRRINIRVCQSTQVNSKKGQVNEVCSICKRKRNSRLSPFE